MPFQHIVTPTPHLPAPQCTYYLPTTQYTHTLRCKMSTNKYVNPCSYFYQARALNCCGVVKIIIWHTAVHSGLNLEKSAIQGSNIVCLKGLNQKNFRNFFEQSTSEGTCRMKNHSHLHYLLHYFSIFNPLYCGLTKCVDCFEYVCLQEVILFKKNNTKNMKILCV